MIVRKLQLVAMGATFSILAVGGYLLYTAGFNKGVDRCETAYQKDIERFEAHQRKIGDELSKIRRERDRLLAEKLEGIYTAPDPSGCADVAVPDRLLEALRPSPDRP